MGWWKGSTYQFTESNTVTDLNTPSTTQLWQAVKLADAFNVVIFAPYRFYASFTFHIWALRGHSNVVRAE